MTKRNFICLLLGALLIASAVNSPAQVQLGSEVLATNQFKALVGKRIGLITNPSGVNRQSQSIIDVLLRAPGVKLVALFGAEHGIRGDAGAGQAVTNMIDARTGLPVFSLYGNTRKPTPAMLKGLDALVYDIQDTGCRAYTFISTMGLAMEACAEVGIEFVVLDRPNPLGGERVEGPLLNPRFRSFVGRWDVPYVYGMTCGELARMINGERWIPKRCKLTVIPLKNWKRGMIWSDTGLKWVPTSPHVPTGDSPMFQVATGMIGEIGGVNIAMHTTAPFQCVAAPWLDAANFCATLNRYRLPSVRFEPVSYASANGANRLNGAKIVFTDSRHAPLTALNFYVLEAVRMVSGRDLFAEAMREKRSFVMFDKVNGTDATRRDLQARRSAANIVKSWKSGEEAFRQKRRKYLLY